VVALQTIVAREVVPGDPAVVSVGSFHGGTQNNIIPDEVKLQLTVRTYKPATRERILAAIVRITKAEALAAGAPKEPLVEIKTAAHSAYNDPELTGVLVAKLRTILGPDKLIASPPKMAFDDFAEYGLAGAREVMLWLGAVSPEKYAAAQKPGAPPLPGVHSPFWAPDYSAALRTGMTVETAALLELLNRK
jgi:metal-dependent amidase/aminoacylase/carboxypeptidase family protein